MRDPVIVWSGKQNGPFSKLLPTEKNEVHYQISFWIILHSYKSFQYWFNFEFKSFRLQLYCVPKFTAARIPKYNDTTNIKNQSRTAMRPLVLTWQYPDTIIRVKSENVEPLIKSYHNVTCVEIGEKYIYIGFDTGIITVIKYECTPNVAMIKTNSFSTNLYAHTDSVLSISTCAEFGLMVSSSSDSSCVLWDTLNRPNYPSYGRAIRLSGAAYLVDTSRTSGDIAIVNRPNDEDEKCAKSVLSLYSINGHKIGGRTCEPPITALAFSAAKEGRSVNVVATGHGLRTGVIRLWSTWDLSPVRDIPTSQISTIIAISFSLDNLTLYVATEDDEIIILEPFKGNNSSSTKKYTPKICVLSS